MKVDFLKKIISQCDQELRAGRSGAVRALLAPLVMARVPRDFRLPLARICRRAGLWASGLRLLSPILYPKTPSAKPATSHERAEYGVLLMKIGSLREAATLLERVNSEEAPEALLFRAFCCFAQWDYASAIPILKEYLSHDISPDAVLIAKVNLASALLESGQFDAAEPVLDQNIRQSGEYPRILGNSWQLLGQLHFLRGELAESRRALEASLRQFTHDQTVDLLFIHKWLAILSSTEERTLEPLQRFRNQAMRDQHWESVRDADFYILKQSFDESQFLKLYFGTPHPEFRAKLSRSFPGVPVPAHFEIGEGLVYDAASGKWASHSESAPDKVHQLIRVLTSDLYRPINFGGIFSALFPEDRFDIYSSPNRVHQNLWRTRGWLKKVGMPAEIQYSSGSFRFRSRGPITLRLAIHPERGLLAHLPAGEFSAQELRSVLKISRATAQRLVKSGVEEGRLVRTGAGKNTRYRRAS